MALGSNSFSNAVWLNQFKARRGSGFYEIFCIFANMSCLCIHLVKLFNLPCKNFLSWNKLFYVIKHRFCGMLHHPKVFISVKLPV